MRRMWKCTSGTGKMTVKEFIKEFKQEPPARMIQTDNG